MCVDLSIFPSPIGLLVYCVYPMTSYSIMGRVCNVYCWWCAYPEQLEAILDFSGTTCDNEPFTRFT